MAKDAGATGQDRGRERVRLALMASGHVQHVGFRSYTRGLARRYRLTGWVRNLPDGRVDMEVQGARDAVEAFVEALVTPLPTWRIRVSGLERRQMAPVAGEPGFEVRWYR